jgi:CRISPR/Cas system-associated exonuclease Cas4 (RecB family)
MAADKRPPLAALLEAFDRTFRACSGGATPILWEDDGGPEAMAQKAHQLLTLYYDTCSPHRVLAVEKGFVFQRVATGVSGVEEEALTGVVDLIEEDADGGVFVTELKTAARRFDDVRLRFDHQMSIYSAARKVLGFPDAKLRFRVLLKTKKPAIETYEVQRDEAQVAETAVVVSQVLRAIDGAIFFPVRSWQCTNCAYRLACGT